MAGNDNDREREEQPRVIISDKRHSRSDDDAAAEAEAPQAAEPELEVVEPEAREEPAGTAAEPPAEPPATEQAPPAEHEHHTAGHHHAEDHHHADDEELPSSAEMDQLKMIFDAGITSYLAGQVSMIINFALIYLGRAANPATGIVATDIKKAKTAIDSLEFVSAQIKDELPEAEQKQLAGIVADLKYTFMQAATGGPAPTTPPGNGG